VLLDTPALLWRSLRLFPVGLLFRDLPAISRGGFPAVEDGVMRRTLLHGVIVCCLASAGTAVAQSSMDQMGRDVRTSQPSAPSSPSNSKPDDGDSWGDLAGDLVGDLVFAPFLEAGNHVLVGPYHPFVDYPFEGGFRGLMAPAVESPDQIPEPFKDHVHLSTWTARISLEEGYDWGDEINRVKGSVLFDTSCGLGVQTNWSVLTQRRPCGGTDVIGLGNTDFTLRMIETPRFQMRTGIGFRNFIDRYGDDWGLNFHADADWFIRRPWVVSTAFDYGNVGNAAVTHARGTVGWMWDRWEVFAGYDYECVGTVPIRGPVAGVRLYF
jgi:hypothetical protein